MVLVNQPESAVVNVTLPERAENLAGQFVTEVSLGAASGEVLSTPCASKQRPRPPEDVRATGS